MGHVDSTIPRVAEDCGFETAFRDAPVKWPTPVGWIVDNKTTQFLSSCFWGKHHLRCRE